MSSMVIRLRMVVNREGLGILCQAAHVLHVGIFLDGEYCLLIGKTELVLMIRAAITIRPGRLEAPTVSFFSCLL